MASCSACGFVLARGALACPNCGLACEPGPGFTLAPEPLAAPLPVLSPERNRSSNSRPPPNIDSSPLSGDRREPEWLGPAGETAPDRPPAANRGSNWWLGLIVIVISLVLYTIFFRTSTAETVDGTWHGAFTTAEGENLSVTFYIRADNTFDIYVESEVGDPYDSRQDGDGNWIGTWLELEAGRYQFIFQGDEADQGVEQALYDSEADVLIFTDIEGARLELRRVG